MEETRAMINSKWTATVASVWIQCTSGSLYTFAIYSSALKSTQGYDQSTLDTVSVFKDFGANVGLLSGILYSSSVSSGGRGPWVVLAAGAIQCFIGYFLIWLSVAGLIPRPPVVVMCLFMLLTAHAQTFFNTANVVTAVHNFPNYSGTIVGIMKGFLGLSGAILIQTYQAIFKNKPTSFLLMLSLLPTFNTLLFMWFVRISHGNEADEKKHLNRLSLIAMVIAAYLMVVIISENIVDLNLLAHVTVVVVLLMLLALPLCVTIKAQHGDSVRISRTSLVEDHHSNDPTQMNVETVYNRPDHSGYQQVSGGADHETASDDKAVQCKGNLNLLQAICTSNFWFLFLATACGMASGLTTVNNFSQIGGSLGYTNIETNALVSLWSIWNFLGRFGAGYVSEYLLHVKGLARPLFMAVTLATMSIGHSLIASGLPGALYIGSILVGVCYSSQWSLMPTIASEIFGIANLGTIFNTITIASPLGSYILSVWVVGYIYDKEASVEGKTCTGTHCFMLAFFIMAFVTFLGFLFALWLFLKTRTFYNQVILRRLQHSVGE